MENSAGYLPQRSQVAVKSDCKSVRQRTKVILPPLSKKAAVAARSAYDNFFAVLPGRSSNAGPKEVTPQKSLVRFKTILDNFINNLPEKPPTPGYSGENGTQSFTGLIRKVVCRWRDDAYF